MIMRFHLFIVFPLFLIAGASPTLPSREATSLSDNNSVTCTTVQCAQDALAFAFTYGYPLYSFGSLVQTGGDEPAVPTNFLIHQRTLRTAEDKEIIRPNADTLYSNLFIDLSLVDLEITVPEFGDRYGMWPFYDLYGNNFANIGSVTNFTSGKFLLRYDQNNIGLSASSVSNTTYNGIINMPTPYGQSIVRIVTDNSVSDLEIVHGLQDQLQVRPIPRANGLEPVAPAFDLTLFKEPYFRAGNGTSLPEAVLRLTAALAPTNEPESLGDRGWVAETLQNAGCADGKWTQPTGTNLTAAVAVANESATALLLQPGYNDQAGNGWSLLDSRIIGNYRSYYQARYFVASWGYLALTDDQAMYPSNDAVTEIGPDHAILVQFAGGRPALKNQGFWSLTVYDEDGFFVPNELNRYALGDRSNLTFADGTAVYGEEANNGPFEILIQPEDVKPPTNWTSNWLPAQAGGGVVGWNLRWYGAEDTMRAGGLYEYPTISLVNALRG